MALEIVASNSTEIAHQSSVDVRFSGVHIGGGLYLGANHNPNAGPHFTAIPQRSLDTEAESHQTTELDYTLPADASLWPSYTTDYNIYISYDQALHVGDALTSTGAPYAGPAAPMLIAADPDELFGDVIITGYPAASVSLNGQGGVLHQDASGQLSTNDHTEEDVNGDQGGYFTITGAEALGGMSGGGTFLSFDPDGDGTLSTYLIATSSATGESTFGPPQSFVFSTSIAPHYGDLGAAITNWSGPNPRSADDFGRMVLLSGQTAGSAFTTVDGQLFHEDIYGGVNADTIYGGGGDDMVRAGDGDDMIFAGSGDDTLTGGAGADLFDTRSFGKGATDIITDFSATEGDIIDLGYFFSDISAVQAASTETGGDLHIDLGSKGLVILQGVTWAEVESQIMLTCFAADTLVDTPDGPRPITEIKAGDAVITRQGQAIVGHVLRRDFRQDVLAQLKPFWPITIEAGALGPNCPSRPLTVSPQHRVLIDSPVTDRMNGGPVLIAAKKLLGWPGIHQNAPDADFSYIHLVMDRHEILRTHNSWTESFYPGPQAMIGASRAQLAEFEALFGANTATTPPPFAHPVYSGKILLTLLRRHKKNGHALQARSSPDQVAG